MSFDLLLATRVLAHAGLAQPLPPFTASRAFTAWTVDPFLALGVLAVGGLYLLGVRRLAERGAAWPRSRTLSFIGLGLGSIVVATMSGIATYDEVSFTGHMVQHMILAMITPVFLALGAPITLALRTLPGTSTRGPRGLLQRLLHTRLARVLSFPPLGLALFIATPFALYFTGLYAATLDHPVLHELLHVHFLVVGCLFFWPLLGLDPIPGRVSYPFRMLVVFAALPFHAFLGIAIMSRTSLIAASHYEAVARALPWYDYAQYDQTYGGGLLWASGDLVGLLFFAVLFVQWMHAEERLAVREDRRLDRLDAAAAARAAGPMPQLVVQDAADGAEDALAAYNAYLARLAARSGG